jgi:hypothetical protein
MTARYFCDGCDREIDRNYVSRRFKPSHYFKHEYAGTNISAEVIVTVGGVSNAGHLCRPCLDTLLVSRDFG